MLDMLDMAWLDLLRRTSHTQVLLLNHGGPMEPPASNQIADCASGNSHMKGMLVSPETMSSTLTPAYFVKSNWQ